MIAVLSGDIIQSGSLKGEGAWLNELKEIFKKVESRFKLLGSGAQIFRGDGFQLGLENPKQALSAAILIRAGLLSGKSQCDARIAIGIGEADYVKENILESDGEAFRHSGRLLDELKKDKNRLALASPFDHLNNEMEVSLKLLGVILDNWSQADAETAWLSWMEGLTQKKIQKKLGISQPAVSKRKSNAKLAEIQLLLNRFESLISSL
jgi:predicted XRE-type DNA-binding protein